MSLSLNAIVVRHERRLRLLFSGSLAAGAFTPAPYAILPDNAGVPLVLAAYVVPNSPNVVELALDRDLSQWSGYVLTALSVPGADGSFTSGVADATSSAPFALAFTPTPPNVENPDADLGALVYGEDLVWDGFDFVETDQGDLATISGLANLEAALLRRVAQDVPLPWSPSYGDRPGRYVNGPSPLASTVAGDAQRQAMQDDRVKSAAVSFGPAPGHPERTIVTLTIVPIGAATTRSPIVIPLITV